MHFSFEKHVPSQVLKDFFVENLETTPLSQITNYWDRILRLYIT